MSEPGRGPSGRTRVSLGYSDMTQTATPLTRSQELARHALDLLTRQKVPATPQNYEVFYTYVSGQNAELTTLLNSYLRDRKELSEQMMTSLHARFFPKQQMDSEVLEVGDQLQTELTKLASQLERAGRDQREYGEHLDEMSGRLDSDDTAELKTHLARLADTTRLMSDRTRALEGKLAASKAEIDILKLNLENIRNESLTDPLTGLPNRRCLDDRIAQAIQESQESGSPLTLLMGDIDHFKMFNDQWGHQTGDQVLRLVANCLKENVKGRDTAARYGGEEFAVILPDTSLADGMIVAEQIRSKVESKRVVKKSTGESLGVITLSLGAASLRPGEGEADLIRRADACLYAAKRQGRNRVVGEGGLPKEDEAGAPLRRAV